MPACTCKFTATSYVMPGWGCCQCKVYNGMQRLQCKHCGHERRVIDLPPGFVQHTCGFAWDVADPPDVVKRGLCPCCHGNIKPVEKEPA